MEDPEHHAAAAREHAERARGDGRQNDPPVLAGLAQAEALLAVAAAISSLAAAITPQPASAPGPDREHWLAGIRDQYPSAYKPWTADADNALLRAHRDGQDPAGLAEALGRQPSAIRSRLRLLTMQDPRPAGPEG